MENKIYDFNDVLEIVYELSFSQGFYGRLYRALIELRENDNPDYYEFCDYIASKKLKTPLDVVYMFEC